jgi:hypothetical protein
MIWIINKELKELDTKVSLLYRDQKDKYRQMDHRVLYRIGFWMGFQGLMHKHVLWILRLQKEM